MTEHQITIEATDLGGLPPSEHSNMSKISAEDLAKLYQWETGQVLRFGGFNGAEPQKERASMVGTIRGFARTNLNASASLRSRDEDGRPVLYAVLNEELEELLAAPA